MATGVPRWSARGVAILCAIGLIAPAAATPRRVELGSGMVAVSNPDGGLMLEAMPRRNEGLIAFSRRLCGDDSARARIQAVNGGIRRLLAGVRYKVPYELLDPPHQQLVLGALFGGDHLEPDGWHHIVQSSQGNEKESLWSISEWFTGSGGNYRVVREFNNLADEEIVPGQELVIPRGLLIPALLALGPRLPEPPPDLSFGEDSVGAYALYALKPGEALYSSVVVRFTGRIYAEDVNRLAADLARRNGIADVTDMPVGFPVKIPTDLLLPEYLPSGHPRRVEYESDLSRSAGFSNQLRSSDLMGVTVVLDSGHGGRDVGAGAGGTWESVYVYDIMMRTRRLLMSTTAAGVVATTREGSDYEIRDRDVLSLTRGHAVLTTPPYAIADSRISANLRWYLANSIFSRQSDRGREPEKVVFVSIHADSLHSSLRGAMVYLPGIVNVRNDYGRTGTVYTSRKEVRERPRVTFSQQDRVRSEGLSRELAQQIIRSFRSAGLTVHSNKPVRDRVIRSGRTYVPAVLRYNAVPAKVLVEVCNLANPSDRRLLQTREFRERVAAAIVDGLLSYYGSGSSGSDVRVAGS